MKCLFWLLPVALVLLSCSFFGLQPLATGNESATATVEPILSSFPKATLSESLISTPTNTVVPTVTPTATSGIPLLMAKEQAVNCRYGPGAEWAVVTTLDTGLAAEIIGKSQDGSWWYIRHPLRMSLSCWVSDKVATVSGNRGSVPVIPMPVAQVTKVQVAANVANYANCAGPNGTPVWFIGKITTTGPGTVKYRWELRGNLTLDYAEEEYTFSQADTGTVESSALFLPCGDYRVVLHVLVPNEKQDEFSFMVTQSP